MGGIIPTFRNASAIVVDSQSNSVYPKVLLDLAYFDGSSCEPNYQQRTVVMTQRELSALTQQEFNQFEPGFVEPYNNITQVEYACTAEVDGCLTADGFALAEGKPLFCYPSEVMAKFAHNSPYNVCAWASHTPHGFKFTLRRSASS
jgi:hypothetical protein